MDKSLTKIRVLKYYRIKKIRKYSKKTKKNKNKNKTKKTQQKQMVGGFNKTVKLNREDILSKHAWCLSNIRVGRKLILSPTFLAQEKKI